MAEETKDLAIVEGAPVELQLSLAAIETTKHNIALCEQLVKEVLEKDVDWGTIPGIDHPFLWDSGAAKIMAAFNCYSRYTVLDKIDKQTKQSFTIQAELINRHSYQVIATGIGACSTTEKRYRYILKDPQGEAEELLNTVAKMAAKRADVDAVTSLPGVSGTLRKLFRPTKSAPEKTPWSLFYAKLNTLGVSPGRAHSILNVPSIKDDWVEKQHRTLDEAYDIIKSTIVPPLKGEEPAHDAKA